MPTRTLPTILILALALVSCESGPKVGSDAPPFAAEDAQGETVNLAAYDGKVLILDFWAVW